jgi:hypothetical protein
MHGNVAVKGRSQKEQSIPIPLPFFVVVVVVLVVDLDVTVVVPVVVSGVGPQVLNRLTVSRRVLVTLVKSVKDPFLEPNRVNGILEVQPLRRKQGLVLLALA